MASEQGYWKRLPQRRLSRRRLLKGAALGSAGLAAAAIIGCGEDEEPAASPGRATPAAPAATPAPAATATPAAKQPKRGGTLVRRHIGAGAYALGLDPYTISGNETGIMMMFYQSLIRTDPLKFQPEPELAQKWEQPSPTEYVFRLAPTVKWHNKPPVNGRELTSQDVVSSLERARTSDPKYVNRSLLATVDKIEAVDKGTVRITTKVPDATTLVNLGDWTMLVTAPEVFEKFDKLTGAEHAIGTGAFILTARDDVSATMVRNPAYWKAGLPYLDGLRMQVVKEDRAAFSAFLAGQLDHIIVPGTEAKKFFDEQARAKRYLVDKVKAINTFYLYTNTRKPPYNDARVTKALRLLMDHQEAITAWAEVWFGSGTSYMLTHAMEDWDLSPEEYSKIVEWKQPKDEAAKESLALLSAAGFTKDKPLKVELLGSTLTDWNSAIAQLQQAMFKRLAPGVVEADLKMVEDALARSLEARGEFEVRAPTARASWFDPDQLFRTVFHSKGGQNFGKYSDPTLDGLIDKQQVIFKVEERKAAVKEVVRHLIDKAPYTSFISRDWPNAAQLKLQNWAPEGGRSPGFQYEQIWLDV